MWSVAWQAYANAFAQAALAEKQARKRTQFGLYQAELKRLAELRANEQTDEQIVTGIFAQWKAENRQAESKRQANLQGKRLKFSELPIFKTLALREKKTNE